MVFLGPKACGGVLLLDSIWLQKTPMRIGLFRENTVLTISFPVKLEVF